MMEEETSQDDSESRSQATEASPHWMEQEYKEILEICCQKKKK